MTLVPYSQNTRTCLVLAFDLPYFKEDALYLFQLGRLPPVLRKLPPRPNGLL